MQGFRRVDEKGRSAGAGLTGPRRNCAGRLAAVRAMVKAKWMLVGDVEGGKQRSTRQKRIKALNSTKMNVYVLTSAALEGGE